MAPELERLRAENELLRMRVDELEAILLRQELPQSLRLTLSEKRLLSMLLARPLVSRNDAMTALYRMESGDPPGDRIVDVFVSRLRKELRRHGVQVHTRWGDGWWIEKDDKAKLRELP